MLKKNNERGNDFSIKKSQIFWKDVNESEPRSNVHYLGSSENKAWKKIQACTGFEPMTSAICEEFAFVTKYSCFMFSETVGNSIILGQIDIAKFKFFLFSLS